MNCKNCGAILGENDSFCTQCGQPVDANDNVYSNAINNQENTNQINYNSSINYMSNQNNYSNNQIDSNQVTNNEENYINNYSYSSEDDNSYKYNEMSNKINNYDMMNNANNYNTDNTTNTYNPTYIKSSQSSKKISVWIVIFIMILAIAFCGIGFVITKMFLENNDYDEDDVPSISENEVETDNDISDDEEDIEDNAETDVINDSNNYIITSKGKKVYFKVPSTLSVAENMLSPERERIFIEKEGEREFYATIEESNTYTLDGYFQYVDEVAKEIREDTDCKDVQLSDKKTMTVAGKTFTYKFLNYKGDEDQSNDLYIAFELGDKSLYIVEIYRYDLITNDELKDLLTITIED